MSDKRRITASCLLKLDGQALRVQLSPAVIYGGPEGAYRARVNRVWLNGHDGSPLFVDRAGLAELLAGLLQAGVAQVATCPDIPADARVAVQALETSELLNGWTYSTPIRADDGIWYVLVSAGGRRFFARCDDVRLLPLKAQPASVRKARRGQACQS